MKTFGNKEEFAIEFSSNFVQYPGMRDDMEDPVAYMLGGRIYFWVKGKNMFALRDRGPTASYSYDTLHFLVNFLSKGLVDHLSETPFPLQTNSTNIVDILEEFELVSIYTKNQLALVNFDFSQIPLEKVKEVYQWIQARSFLMCQHFSGQNINYVALRSSYSTGE